MNIKVPKHIKSPTVIIVGSQEPDNKMNDYHAKRMDSLEKKLDMQYKSFSDKNSGTQDVIVEMNRTFNSMMDRYAKMNQAMMTGMHKSKMESMKKDFENRIKAIENDDRGDVLLKSFSGMASKLEKSIKEIKPQVVQMSNGRSISHDYMTKSLDSLYEKMSKLISSVRPKMIPYVS